MFMATKTITITEAAFNILAEKKIGNESYSEMIKRVFSKRRTKKLEDFSGMLSEEEGKNIMADLKGIREKSIEMVKERTK